MRYINSKRKIQLYLKFSIFLAVIFFHCFIGKSLYVHNPNSRIRITSRNRRLEDCTDPADPTALIIGYVLGVLYMFLIMALLADELFVPALQVIANKLKLSQDVAGATLMAAGGSSPEFFTALVGTFQKSDVGFGAVVGSAVFNVLFVIGICVVIIKKPIALSWWPLVRDCTYYTIVLITLSIFFGVTSVSTINWWEALIIHFEYWIKLKTNNVAPAASSTSTAADLHHAPFNGNISMQKGRRGLAAMMMNRISLDNQASIGGSVDDKFHEIDSDHNGVIDLKELGTLFQKMGLDNSEDMVNSTMKDLAPTGSNAIDLAMFKRWYLSSEQRLLLEVTSVFDTIDVNRSGSINEIEFKALLQNLGVDENESPGLMAEFTNNAVTPLPPAILTAEDLAHKHSITLHQFQKWYMDSKFWKERLEKVHQLKETAEAVEEGLSLAPPLPKDRTAINMLWYLFLLPIVFCLKFTVVDVRKPGYWM